LIKLAQAGCLALVLVICCSWQATPAAEGDAGVIRLGKLPDDGQQTLENTDAYNAVLGQTRRGFDHESFEAQLEALWFQRKAYLADGRETDATDQADAIRAFCKEEGVKRMENLAAALIAESERYLLEGRHDIALESLDLALALDPGRPQTHFARAAALRKSDAGLLASGGEFVRGLKASLVHALQSLSLVSAAALVLVVAVIGLVLVFALLMLFRYQIPFRHEVEEIAVHFADERIAQATGWFMLFLPLVLWVSTGWAALYWIVITFRFMRRGEKAAAAILLIAASLAMPAYRAAVSIFGVTADPVVRTTLASAGGEYNPDRILKLQRLVQAYPEDPSYRFLLAGLFKNGRYFEEAFAEYREALRIDPGFAQAHINVGNIFYETMQYAEAVASYNRALEYDPDSMLAYFNMHLAQSEAFNFKGAEKSLERARAIDPERLAEMLTAANSGGEGAAVMDASLKMTSVWQAALSGGRPEKSAEAAAGAFPPTLARQLLNPVSLVALGALLACGCALFVSRGHAPALRCIRCGRPFCHYCKSVQEGREYCSQCLHLFVLGDGLAPETKTRKMYEVERYEKRSRAAKRLLSAVLPGAAQILRGNAARGTLLLLAWLSCLIAWQPVVLLPLERITGADLRLDLLEAGSVPAMYGLQASTWMALLALPVIWLLGNAWRRKRREL
jgi:tetratricopeptide (TPR) repeat protein